MGLLENGHPLSREEEARAKSLERGLAAVNALWPEVKATLDAFDAKQRRASGLEPRPMLRLVKSDHDI